MEPLGDIVGNTDVSSVHNEDSTSYNENITEKDDIISTDGSMDDIPDYYIFKIYLFFIAWETFDLANEQYWFQLHTIYWLQEQRDPLFLIV